MKAIVQQEYGPPEEVLELRDIDKPSVRDHDVLVRVRAAPLAGDDWHLMRGLPYVARLATGLFSPKHLVPGREVAGQVEATGGNVTQFKPGDEVFGWCNGAFAEYVSVAEDALALKPTNITFEQAAAVPVSAFTALQGLRDEGRLRPGHKVLIVGASGGVGTFAVQLAKAFGADVTGVCSTSNADMVRSIGADHIIDYTREDFTQSGQGYDLILDIVGNRSLSDCRRALIPKGSLVLVGTTGGLTSDATRLRSTDRWLMGTGRWIKALALSPFVSQRLRPLIHTDSKEDLIVL
ncbi:MAG: NAD(P)-dependent alcohol dehydrogenase, partial [Gemmatimonadales bacterium]